MLDLVWRWESELWDKAERERDRQTDRQKERETDRERGWEGERETGRVTDIQTESQRQK